MFLLSFLYNFGKICLYQIKPVKCTPHFLDEAPDEEYQLCNNIMEPMPMSKVRLKGSFHYLSGGWIYSQPRDQTCSVYGWHACNAAGSNPTGVERSCHAQGA